MTFSRTTYYKYIGLYLSSFQDVNYFKLYFFIYIYVIMQCNTICDGCVLLTHKFIMLRKHEYIGCQESPWANF